MRILMAGAAALALAASGAYAKPGNGNGHGNDKHGNQAGQHHQQGKKADRGPQRMAKNDDKQDKRQQARSVERKQDRRVERRMEAREDRRDDRRWEQRAERRDERTRYDNRDDRYGERDRYDDRDRRVVRVNYDRDDWRYGDASRGLIDGCPPGLAKKNNGCTPPGQLKNRENEFYGYNYRPRLFGLSNYDSGRYYYRDGYLMRYGDGGGISGYIPLLGGALAIGNPWPTSYRSYDVPNYYVDYYDLGASDRYRYADNVIYRVDPQDAAIMSIAALLTGDDITIGQPMPSGYDVYNVPYAYRDRYYDTPEANYRYSDGYVYRIDPTTQLVAAAIDLLV